MSETVSWVFDNGMLFNVACKHALSIDAPARKGGQKAALVSIVFSVMTLEAFINELAEFASETALPTPKVIETLGEFLTDAERANASLETKFKIGSWIMTGEKTERGEQPFQDFALLVRLRNDIVHFKANDKFENGLPAGQVHTHLINKFWGKKLLAEGTNQDKLSWSHLIQTKAVAEWSCKTAARMITDFYKKMPADDFRACIVPSEELYDADKLFSDEEKSKWRKKSKYYCDECGWESEWMFDVASEPPHECKKIDT